MWIYFIIFAIALVGFIISPVNTSGSRKAFTIYWFALALFVALGDMLGGSDRYIYGELFDTTVDYVNAGGSVKDTGLWHLYTSEQGYIWFNQFMGLFTRNRYIFIITITLIIYSLSYRQLVRYSDNYFLSMILFFGLLFFFTFTYLRQMLAAVIVWQAVQSIIDRKLWKFLIITAIGYSFHNAALIFIPIYFFPLTKMKTSTIIILAALALAAGISGITSILFAAYGDASEMESRAAAYSSDDSGFRIEYLIEAVLFLTMIIVFYRQIPSDKHSVVMLNMAVVFCLVLLFFIKSLNGGRLSWFFLLGLICTITSICEQYIRMRQWWPSALMIIMSALLFTRILFVWPVFYPYKTCLTPGYVHDVWAVHDKYEYDANYDYDKFYR